MEFGVGYFPTHDGNGPGPLARLVEEHGQESLFFAEHTHIPAARETPWPGGQAIGLPAAPSDLERAQQAGLTRVVHWLPSGGRAHVEPALERWEAAVADFNGE